MPAALRKEIGKNSDFIHSALKLVCNVSEYMYKIESSDLSMMMSSVLSFLLQMETHSNPSLLVAIHIVFLLLPSNLSTFKEVNGVSICIKLIMFKVHSESIHETFNEIITTALNVIEKALSK